MWHSGMSVQPFLTIYMCGFGGSFLPVVAGFQESSVGLDMIRPCLLLDWLGWKNQRKSRTSCRDCLTGTDFAQSNNFLPVIDCR